MKRRDFSRQFLLTGSALGLQPLTQFVSSEVRQVPKILPKSLNPGDTVGIIAPASPFPPEYTEKAELNMEALGLHIKWSRHLSKRNGYLAGKDRHRLKDLHAMFEDPEVKAIWCMRGGYGTTRLLPEINYELIRKNPKILVGYSDVTALLNAIHNQTGLVCFHGPVAGSEFSAYTVSMVRKMLFETSVSHRIGPADSAGDGSKEGWPIPIRGGRAEGELVGGNLSLMAALCGTAFQPEVRNRIVFLEDIGEKPYRVDRLLTQLRQALPLEQAAGIMLGRFVDCAPGEDDASLSLEETLKDRLKGLGIPVGYGFPFGHIRDQCTLPVGARVWIDTRRMIVETREPVVVS